MNRFSRLAFILALLLVSCGLFGGTVNPRAADYYNFLSGVNIKVKYASFLSPALYQAMQPEDLGKLDKAYSQAQKTNSRSSKVLPKDVYLTQAGRFAFTVVRAELGRPYTGMAPVRWVKVGSKWFIYLGTQQELKAYGYFPQELQPPSAVAGGGTGAGEATGETSSRVPKPEDEEAFGGKEPPAETSNPPAGEVPPADENPPATEEPPTADDPPAPEPPPTDDGGGSGDIGPLPVPGK